MNFNSKVYFYIVKQTKRIKKNKNKKRAGPIKFTKPTSFTQPHICGLVGINPKS